MEKFVASMPILLFTFGPVRDLAAVKLGVFLLFGTVGGSVGQAVIASEFQEGPGRTMTRSDVVPSGESSLRRKTNNQVNPLI